MKHEINHSTFQFQRILKCGHINPNPGPAKSPCAYCENDVAKTRVRGSKTRVGAWRVRVTGSRVRVREKSKEKYD